MASTPQTATPSAPAPVPLAKTLLADPLWRAPLVLIALACTAGLALDRHFPIPFPISLIVAGSGLIAWATVFFARSPAQAAVYLWLTAAALGAAHHHRHCHVYPADDIGYLVDAEPRLAVLRGVLEEEPYLAPRAHDDLRVDWQKENQPPALSVLAVTHLRQENDWRRVSGRVRVSLSGLSDPPDTRNKASKSLQVGDEIEVIGRLSAPPGRVNPGGFDFQAHLHDQRIRAILTPSGNGASNYVRLKVGWPRSIRGSLTALRGRCRRTVEEQIPPKTEAGLAVALLLGDGSAMSAADWDRYVRTGVVQVLVVSGQHLVVLGCCLWFVLHWVGCPRRASAVLVALFLLFYSLMVGGQPPVMRAAVMAIVACGGLLFRRPGMIANSFALSWLVVGILDPSDLCTAGCQLSFLSVALLCMGAGWWSRRQEDPLDRLVENVRPAWQRFLLWAFRYALLLYGVNLSLWLAVTPLVAARYNMVPLVGLPITPPLVFLSSLALIFGFLMLLTAPVAAPLAAPFAWATRWCLTGCDQLVDWADAMPGGYWYVSDIPDWWLWLFYGTLLAVVMLESLHRHWRWFALAGLGWLCVGLIGGAASRTSEELRCTFLSVGHGGCAVIETPDGRTLLYDAGTLVGPDVARRHIAPYLRHRGIRRVDEVILSHADIDHFNGLPSLLNFFAVGQVTMTPSFSDKEAPAVQQTMAEIAKRGVPIRRVRVGNCLRAGDVEMTVLHPPEVGPEGNENARSLVLLVRHAGHTLLLTGDLEGAGLNNLLAQESPRVDVLMAPHHGSRTSNTPELARWASPKVVIASQGRREQPGLQQTYSAAHVLDTWTSGAVTIRSHATGLVVEAFRTGERIVVPSQARHK